MGKKIDMTGWKMWEHGVPDSIITVIAATDRRKASGEIYWKCQCNCGNFLERPGQDIRKGITKSCGCLEIQRKSKLNSVIIGNIYGYLKVIEDLGLKQSKNYKEGTPRKGYFRHYYLCQCLLCNNIVEIRSDSLLNGHTSSCGCIKSKGEEKISKILNENKIKYDHNKIFSPLLNDTKHALRFDFIIYNNDNTINRFVEFDGTQHETGIIGGTWGKINNKEIIQERDTIKNNWCLKNNYLLVRIPYTKLNTLCLDDIMGNKFIYEEGDN